MSRGKDLVVYGFHANETSNEIKGQAAALIDYIVADCPPGRWQSLAITAIEEGCMWAVKSATATPPRT